MSTTSPEAGRRTVSTAAEANFSVVRAALTGVRLWRCDKPAVPSSLPRWGDTGSLDPACVAGPLGRTVGTVQVEVADQAVAAELRRSGEPRRVVAFCVALLATALGIGGVLLARGSALPTPGPILFLALVAALCVNRFALFPTEHASTAEAAVLLAAVVGFRDEAVFLGPLVVALLLGPLDALHWEQRSFVRMANNAGNRGLATLAASAAFVACHDAFGSSPIEWCVVVVVAAGAFVVVDLALSATLLRLLGEPLRSAFRHPARRRRADASHRLVRRRGRAYSSADSGGGRSRWRWCRPRSSPSSS